MYKSMAAKKYLWIIIPIFFLSSFSLSAQQAFVRGSVRDSASGDALIGVVIRTTGGGGTVTDLNGSYNIAVTPGSIKITFTYTGYKKDSVIVNVEAGQSVEQNIKMTNNSKELSLVVISSGRYAQNIGEVPVSL